MAFLFAEAGIISRFLLHHAHCSWALEPANGFGIRWQSGARQIGAEG